MAEADFQDRLDRLVAEQTTLIALKNGAILVGQTGYSTATVIRY